MIHRHWRPMEPLTHELRAHHPAKSKARSHSPFTRACLMGTRYEGFWVRAINDAADVLEINARVGYDGEKRHALARSVSIQGPFQSG